MFTVLLFHLATWGIVVYYYTLWNYPKRWQKLVAPRDPVDAMSLVGLVEKVVIWSCAFFNSDFRFQTYAWPVYGVALLLVAFGQLLNAQVYEKLGKVGVYYGNRFGRKTSWITTWPYSHIPDPQYVGCILTGIGGAPFVPLSFTVSNVLSYCVLIYVERQKPLTD